MPQLSPTVDWIQFDSAGQTLARTRLMSIPHLHETHCRISSVVPL